MTGNNDNLVISYLTLRKFIGYLGVGLPVLLVVGLAVMGDSSVIQKTISAYYYTNVRDIFVGILCAVGVFLFTYTGYKNSKDNILTNIAGLSVLGVAFFPTSNSDTSGASGTVHYISAAIFFLTLSYISYFQFTKMREEPTPKKLMRNKIYRICAIIMVICMVLIAAYFNGLDEHIKIENLVFWLETIALWAFGFSWLTKGETLFPDK